ncbi:hypothetical protein AAV28_01210 [Bradyrhizobium diazoefficiens USDA 110]|nr:hypothetical protein AAV28_01210 [Bradyrhizobium diazoefficiens USDA 110]
MNSVADNKKHNATKSQSPFDRIAKLFLLEVCLLSDQVPKRESLIFTSVSRGVLQIFEVPSGHSASIIKCLRHNFSSRLRVTNKLALSED